MPKRAKSERKALRSTGEYVKPVPVTLPAFQDHPIPTGVPITSFGTVIDAKSALRKCEIGKSFIVDKEMHRRRVVGFARRMGFEVKTRVTTDQRYEIWRTK